MFFQVSARCSAVQTSEGDASTATVWEKVSGTSRDDSDRVSNLGGGMPGGRRPIEDSMPAPSSPISIDRVRDDL
jgi:hypothetical protein